MAKNARKCAPTRTTTKPFYGQARTAKGVRKKTEGVCSKGVGRKASGGNAGRMVLKESSVRKTDSIDKRALLKGPDFEP